MAKWHHFDFYDWPPMSQKWSMVILHRYTRKSWTIHIGDSTLIAVEMRWYHLIFSVSTGKIRWISLPLPHVSAFSKMWEHGASEEALREIFHHWKCVSILLYSLQPMHFWKGGLSAKQIFTCGDLFWPISTTEAMKKKTHHVFLQCTMFLHFLFCYYNCFELQYNQHCKFIF